MVQLLHTLQTLVLILKIGKMIICKGIEGFFVQIIFIIKCVSAVIL